MINVWIDGKEFTQKDMDAWKKKRLKRAFHALHKECSASDNIKQMNKELTDIKMQLSYDELIHIMKWKLLIGKWGMNIASTFFKNKRKAARATIIAADITAEKLNDKLEELMTVSDEKYRYVNLFVYPEHYALNPHKDGRLEVIETTGNAPVPTQFFINFGDETGIKELGNTDYTHQSAGTAKLKDGTIIGGVRHQFRNTPTGAEVKLLVEFPYLCPSKMVKEHEKHLAVEFSNWLAWIMKNESLWKGCSFHVNYRKSGKISSDSEIFFKGHRNKTIINAPFGAESFSLRFSSSLIYWI